MNVYVVNMERSKDRWISISKQLDNIGVPYTRFEAVEGSKISNLSDHFDIDRFEHESYHQLSAGEAGCALSHIGIWQKIVESNEAGAIIIEDDAILSGNFSDLYKALQTNTYGYDYLNLSPSPEDCHMGLTDIEKNRTILEKIAKDERTYVSCEPVPHSTMTYYISNKAAKIFLKSATKMYYAVDLLPRYTFPYTKQGFVFPRASVSADFQSEINHLSSREYQNKKINLRSMYYQLFNVRRFMRIIYVYLQKIK